KRMRQRVVAEVVAEWSLGQLLVGIDGAGDAEVGLAGDRRRAGSSAGRRDQQDAVPAEGTSKGDLGQPLRQRHDGSQRQGRPASKETADAERPTATEGGRMMDTDAAVDLVVQADLASRFVFVAGKLDAIHTEVGVTPAGLVGVLRVDLRQRDE